MSVKKMNRFSVYFRIWNDVEARWEYQRTEIVSEKDDLSKEDISEITENELGDYDYYVFDEYFYLVE